MHPAASDTATASSTKAALDHLQLLVEQLLHENQNLKRSLQQTRSELDQVTAHLNHFKHEVAEHERNDRLVRNHIRTMTVLIERSRDPRSAPPQSQIISTSPPLPESLSSLGAPCAKDSSTKATSAKAPSANATAPKATSPKATSPKATSPKATSLEATSLKATFPKAISLKPLSPKAASPNAPSPNAPSPNAPTPNTTAPNKPALKELAPKEPAPKEPAPKEPAPKEPAPKEPAPKEPAPKEPAPKEPAPKEPALREPAPKGPAPKGPAPTERAPTEQAPKEPPPKEPSPKEPSPKAPASKTPTSKAPSWKAQWPKLQSPGASSPMTPLPRASSPRTPSQSLHHSPQANHSTELDFVGDPALPTLYTTTAQDLYASPRVNGNGPRALSSTGSDSPLCPESTPESQRHTTSSRSRCLPESRIDILTSQSPDTECMTDKGSSPTTSVSDALQKAFVAMEKDTTNAVHILHDTSHSVSLRSVNEGEHCVESATQPACPPRGARQSSKSCKSQGKNGAQGKNLSPAQRSPKRSSRMRSFKGFKKNTKRSSSASDSALSLPETRSSFFEPNGRLRRSLRRRQSSSSPQRTANHLNKTLRLKRTKKGYKVSLGLAKDSHKHGSGSRSSSSDSGSDSDSDSSGPGCSVSISRPHNQPAKAQVSMEGGFSDLLHAARKMKGSLGRRKDDKGKVHESNSEGSDLEKDKSKHDSNHAGTGKADNSGIGNGSILSTAAAAAVAGAGAGALCAAESSGKTQGSFPSASGIPHFEGIVGEQNNHFHAAPVMAQNQMNEWSTWQPSERSNPFIHGNTSEYYSPNHISSFPHNPVVEPENRSSFKTFSTRSDQIHEGEPEHHPWGPALPSTTRTEDFAEESPAAGKATENDAVESLEDADMPIIHEITHVPVMPRSFCSDERSEKAYGNRKKTNVLPRLGSPEFLTLHSSSSQLLRWRACPGSKYVDVSRGALAVKHPAAVALEDGKVVMNGKMRILKPLKVASSKANDCYVSPAYDDGSFLPYVPVSGVTLHVRPVRWDNSRYAQTSVQLSFPKEVFDALVLFVRRAYRRQHPRAQISFRGAFISNRRVRKVVNVEPECSVNMTKLQRSPASCSVAEAVAITKKDVVGLVLLYISIEETSADYSSAEATFGLHSMVAHRFSVDRES